MYSLEKYYKYKFVYNEKVELLLNVFTRKKRVANGESCFSKIDNG